LASGRPGDSFGSFELRRDVLFSNNGLFQLMKKPEGLQKAISSINELKRLVGLDLKSFGEKIGFGSYPYPIANILHHRKFC